MAQPNNYLHIILKICLCIKEKKVQVTTKKLKNEKIKCENYVRAFVFKHRLYLSEMANYVKV